jgi:hypothetical protein
MGHFAKVDRDKVIDVIVAEPEFFETFKDTRPGEWIQTSYNTRGNQHRLGGTPLRGNYAGIGYTYDREHDVFYTPQPYSSWTLNHSTWSWEAPVAHPTDGKKYAWNESTQAWDLNE